MIKHLLNFAWNNLTHLISPPFCHYCKIFLDIRSIFCKNCFGKLAPIISHSLKININYSMTVFSISAYQDPIKSLILGKSNSQILTSNYLGQLIWDMTNISQFQFDYLVPIPLHWARQLKRGYNQCQIMAEVLAKKSGKPVLNILQRNKQTKYQFNLNAQERSLNLKDAFSLQKVSADYKNKDLIIIDDLLTSGSTLIAAGKELAKLQPKSINAFVAARVA